MGSNINYILSSNCNPIIDLAVTVHVTEDIVCTSNTGGGATGFGFQLNAFSPEGRNCAYQQYIFALIDGVLLGWINNWPLSLTGALVNTQFVLQDPFGGFLNSEGWFNSPTIPAGSVLRTTLVCRADSGNVIAATFTYNDSQGNQIANLFAPVNTVDLTRP